MEGYQTLPGSSTGTVVQGIPVADQPPPSGATPSAPPLYGGKGADSKV